MKLEIFSISARQYRTQQHKLSVKKISVTQNTTYQVDLFAAKRRFYLLSLQSELLFTLDPKFNKLHQDLHIDINKEELLTRFPVK